MVLNLDTVWPEPYVPVTIFCWIGGYIDIIINMWIPLLRSFFTISTKSNNKEDDLLATLQDKDKRQSFLQYTTRAFCPESLLFWIDAHDHFTKQSQEKKCAFLKQLTGKYLQSSSLYELNLDAKIRNTISKQIEQALASSKEIEDDLLRDLIVHVEIDLQDSFSRYKAFSKK